MNILYEAHASATGGGGGQPLRRLAPITHTEKIDQHLRQALGAA